LEGLRKIVLNEEEEIKIKNLLEEAKKKKEEYEVYRDALAVYESTKKQHDDLIATISSEFSFPKTYGINAIKKALVSLLVCPTGVCPSCNICLSIHEDYSLHIHTETSVPKKKGKAPPPKNIPNEEIKLYISKLDGLVIPTKPNVVEYDENLIRNLSERFLASERAKPRLEELLKMKVKIVYPQEVINAYKEANAVKKLIPTDFVIDEDEKGLREKENKLTIELGGLMKASAIADAKEKERIKKTKELNLLKPKTSTKQDECEIDTTEIENRISDCEKKIAGYNAKLAEIEKSFGQHERYFLYLKNIETIREVEKELSVAFQEYQEAQEEYKASLLLERRYKEYEFDTLTAVVDLINEWAKPHIDQLFKEPIVVKLCTKRNKLNGEEKLQMTTSLEYRHNDISKLSGGERQKCELAYVLAVNEFLGGRFVFFDECTAYIDEETQKDILDYVRAWVDNSSMKKLVMFVEHKTIKGKFDEVIELENQS